MNSALINKDAYTSITYYKIKNLHSKKNIIKLDSQNHRKYDKIILPATLAILAISLPLSLSLLYVSLLQNLHICLNLQPTSFLDMIGSLIRLCYYWSVFCFNRSLHVSCGPIQYFKIGEVEREKERQDLVLHI